MSLVHRSLPKGDLVRFPQKELPAELLPTITSGDTDAITVDNADPMAPEITAVTDGTVGSLVPLINISANAKIDPSFILSNAKDGFAQLTDDEPNGFIPSQYLPDILASQDTDVITTGGSQMQPEITAVTNVTNGLLKLDTAAGSGVIHDDYLPTILSATTGSFQAGPIIVDNTDKMAPVITTFVDGIGGLAQIVDIAGLAKITPDRIVYGTITSTDTDTITVGGTGNPVDPTITTVTNQANALVKLNGSAKMSDDFLPAVAMPIVFYANATTTNSTNGAVADQYVTLTEVFTTPEFELQDSFGTDTGIDFTAVFPPSGKMHIFFTGEILNQHSGAQALEILVELVQDSETPGVIKSRDYTTQTIPDGERLPFSFQWGATIGSDTEFGLRCSASEDFTLTGEIKVTYIPDRTSEAA